MGQYYMPIKLGKNKKSVSSWMYSHDYNNGLKLMEHSWLGNSFVSTVENLLKPRGLWHKSAIVWAGDYADKEKDSESNLFDRCEDKKKIQPRQQDIGEDYKYVVNHTKKLFVDKTKVPVSDVFDGFEFRIHPLPLLTCEGNGRGCGDYHGKDKIIGSWARNVISIEMEIPEGYKELAFTLVE